MANAVLDKAPITRTFRSAGSANVRYRLRYLESFLLADELFKRDIYAAAFEGITVRTFIDLGCNVGFFVCCVAAASSTPSDLVGLAVDGNREMARDTEWHVKQNGLTNVHVDHGAAGFPLDVHEVTFFENPSNVASSAQPDLNPNVPNKGVSKPVKVPAVHVHKRWREIAGDRRVDLLKIDVEGSECTLLKVEKDLLAITDRIVIEWHKWTTSREEVETILREAGFDLRIVIGEDENAGVAVFDRRSVGTKGAH
jgi:FkbM family methyltransferase